jgi:hypothetical protein
MTAPTTTPIPMVPIEVWHTADDGTRYQATIYGEPTVCEHLVIIPGFQNGQLTDDFWIAHVPTGLTLSHGRPGELRGVVARLAHLDWGSVTRENFPGSDIAAAAIEVIRELRFADPSGRELPAHDAWGPDGKGKGLQRTALPLVERFLADLQRAMSKTGGDDSVPLDVPDPTKPSGTRINPEWTFWVFRHVHDFGLAYLLLVVHRLDPQVADSAAAFLADSWQAGETTGELAWQWHQDLLAGKTPELPGVPQLGELFGAQAQ